VGNCNWKKTGLWFGPVQSYVYFQSCRLDLRTLSGPLPDWDSGAESVKEPVKKRKHIQISAGGLDDSDAEGVNPFPSPSKPGPHTLTEEELTKGAQKANRDLSRINEVSTFCLTFVEMSDVDSIKLVSIVATESDEEEEYVPHATTKKAAVKVPPPVRVKVEKCKAQPMEVKAKKNPVLGKTMVTMKTKLKHLNRNNVRMSDLPEFTGEKWQARFLPTLYDKFFSSNKPFDAFYLGNDTFVTVLQAIVEEVYPEVKYKVTSSDSIYFLVSCLTPFYLQDFLFPFLFRHIIVSMKNDPISVPTPLNL